MHKLLILIFSLLFFTVCGAEPRSVNILGNTYTDTSVSSGDALYYQVLDRQIVKKISAGDNRGMVKLRKSENKTVVFFVILALLFVFGLIRLMFAQQFSDSFSLSKNLNPFPRKQVENDRAARSGFYFLYFVSLGFILYYYLAMNKGGVAGLAVAPGIIGCILVVGILFIVRYGAMYLTAWVFNKSQVLKDYFVTAMFTYKLSAILLFPCTLLLLLSGPGVARPMIIVCIILLLAAKLLRYIRNVALIRKLATMHFFHFLVYLCAFEIIPLLVVVKLLS